MMQEIKIALCNLNERRPQLPELYCHITIYPDGSGMVYDGRGKELAFFHNETEIVKTIDSIQGN